MHRSYFLFTPACVKAWPDTHKFSWQAIKKHFIFRSSALATLALYFMMSSAGCKRPYSQQLTIVTNNEQILPPFNNFDPMASHDVSTLAPLLLCSLDQRDTIDTKNSLRQSFDKVAFISSPFLRFIFSISMSLHSSLRSCKTLEGLTI